MGVDVSRRHHATTLLGKPLPVPLVLAPTGLCDLGAITTDFVRPRLH